MSWRSKENNRWGEHHARPQGLGSYQSQQRSLTDEEIEEASKRKQPIGFAPPEKEEVDDGVG